MFLSLGDGVYVRISPIHNPHQLLLHGDSFDVSVGGLINITLGRSIETLPFCYYSLVRDTFVPGVGQKVGIVVSFNEGNQADKDNNRPGVFRCEIKSSHHRGPNQIDLWRA
jgi:hypothetical protein